ncbi:MAG: hypothetical protein MI974_28025 [Chitinophagales bacterium]|nr:hypothetical protein [Chitinophagales bacterium]
MGSKFQEIQRFKQWWLWYIIITVALIPVWGIYQQIVLGKQFGNNPMSDTGLVVFLLLMLLFVAFFRSIHLKTEIDKNGINILFFPFIKKYISWNEINSASVVQYNFIGYGIRLSSRFGTAYNIAGNSGLAIELKNGNKYLIGTQKEEELKEILEHLNIT